MIRRDDPWEQQAYRTYYAAAEKGEVAPRYDALLEKLDCCDGGTISNVDQRLVKAGLILVMPFNRSRMIYVVEKGNWTAVPIGSLALPWRDRARHVGRTRHRGVTGPAWFFSPREPHEKDAARKLRRLVGAAVVKQWERELGLIQPQRATV